MDEWRMNEYKKRDTLKAKITRALIVISDRAIRVATVAVPIIITLCYASLCVNALLRAICTDDSFVASLQQHKNNNNNNAIAVWVCAYRMPISPCCDRNPPIMSHLRDGSVQFVVEFPFDSPSVRALLHCPSIWIAQHSNYTIARVSHVAIVILLRAAHSSIAMLVANKQNIK